MRGKVGTPLHRRRSAEPGTAPFFRGAVAGLGGQGAALIAALLATVLITRSAEVAELGKYAVAAAIAGFISLLTGLQLTNQVARAHSDNEASGFLPWTLVAGALGASAAAALFLVSHFSSAFMVGPLAWLIPSIALQPAIDALTGLLARNGQAGWLLAQQLARATTRPLVVLVIVMSVAPFQAHWIAVIDAVMAIVSLMVMIGIHRVRTLRERIVHRQKLKLAVLLPGVGALFIVAGTWQIIQRTDLLFVGYILGPSSAGRYEVTLRLLEITMSFYAALMVFFLPLITRALKEGWARTAYIHATTLAAQVLFPCLVLMAVWGDLISARLFGVDFSLPLAVFVTLAIGMLAQVAAGPNGFLLMAARRHREIALIGGSIALLNVLLNLALVPAFGVLGAAVASSTAFIALNLAYGIHIQASLGRIRWNNATLRWQLAYLLALATFVGATRLLFGSSPLAFACSCGVASTIFALSARTARVRPVVRSLITSVIATRKSP